MKDEKIDNEVKDILDENKEKVIQEEKIKEEVLEEKEEEQKEHNIIDNEILPIEKKNHRKRNIIIISLAALFILITIFSVIFAIINVNNRNNIF